MREARTTSALLFHIMSSSPIETRPEVVNRCDSRFMTGFKTEFVTGHILMTVFMTELMMVFMTVSITVLN